MQSIKYNLVTLIVFLLCGSLVLASGGGGEKKEGPPEDANKDSFQADQAALRTTESRMTTLIKEIEELVHHKSTAKGHEVEHITKDMQAKHKELQKLVKEFNEKLDHIRFEHPEKGQKITAHKVEVKSLAEMESEFGLDGQLSKVRGKIRRIYGIEEKPEVKEEPPHVQEPEDKPAAPRLKFSQ